MKKINPPVIAIAGLAAGLFVMTQFYTNCSNQGGYPEEVQSLTLGINHPAETVQSAAQFVSPLAHRQFIASIITEAFSNSASSAGYQGALKANVREWADLQGPQLGLACNPWDAHTGGDCGGNIANANLPLARSSTPIREAIRIHLCDEMLGYNEAVTAALANAELTASVPDRNSIVSLSGLFYRGDEPSAEFIDALTEMDIHLKEEGTSAVDRWRLILAEICESTEWQRL